jgi:hypothetical protein
MRLYTGCAALWLLGLTAGTGCLEAPPGASVGQDDADAGRGADGGAACDPIFRDSFAGSSVDADAWNPDGSTQPRVEGGELLLEVLGEGFSEVRSQSTFVPAQSTIEIELTFDYTGAGIAIFEIDGPGDEMYSFFADQGLLRIFDSDAPLCDAGGCPEVAVTTGQRWRFRPDDAGLHFEVSIDLGEWEEIGAAPARQTGHTLVLYAESANEDLARFAVTAISVEDCPDE